MDEKKEAKSFLLRLLARRNYPSALLMQKMTAKGFSKEVASEMVDWAKEEGFINDEEYQSAFVEKEMRLGRGPMVIRWKLRSKGLSEKAADQISKDVQRQQIQKILPKLSSDKRKAMQALYRRGFDSELISEMLKEF